MKHTEHSCKCGHSHCDEHHHEHHHDECCCGHDHEHSHIDNKKEAVLKYGLGAIPVIVGFMVFIPFYISLISAILAYVAFGIQAYVGMIRGFAKKRIFTEFTLMCVATLGAFAIGEYADAAALMYLYSLGETISSSAYSKSKKNISQLIEISPERVNVFRGGELFSITPYGVLVGETIVVRQGERIPLDGIVIRGGGYADTSSVTGESTPKSLYEGVDCISGSMLIDGSVEIKVTSIYENSVVSRLKKAVEEATKKKSSAEKKISRFAAIFTPIAFAVAVSVFSVGVLITGNISDWARAAIMVLVVSCPCSLVLSVPLTYFAGVGFAAASGIVFRGGEVMDRTARLTAVAFDKTGTITQNHMSFNGAHIYSDVTEEQFLSLAKAVLVHSPHTAAVSFCRDCTVSPIGAVTDVQNIGGRGIVCKVDGIQIIFGNAKLMEEDGITSENCEGTCIYGARDGILLGRLDFSSKLKNGVKDTVEKLRELGVERIAVVSGDVEGVVKDTCESVGISEYYSSRTPDEKLDTLIQIMNEQENSHGYTAFCGDGLNDSAVIAAADVGIAMGGCGSALTVESADVVLMDDELSKIVTAINISERTERIANENIALSLGIKIGVLLMGVVLACFNVGIPMGLAIVADVGAAVLTVLNSLRAGKDRI